MKYYLAVAAALFFAGVALYFFKVPGPMTARETITLTRGPVVSGVIAKTDSAVTRTDDACDPAWPPRRYADCMSIPVIGACDLPERDRIWFRDHEDEAGPMHALGVRCPGDNPDNWPSYAAACMGGPDCIPHKVKSR